MAFKNEFKKRKTSRGPVTPMGINWKGEKVRVQLEDYARDPAVYKRSVKPTPPKAGISAYKHGGRFRPQHD